jgi:hypothetical protein
LSALTSITESEVIPKEKADEAEVVDGEKFILPEGD